MNSVLPKITIWVILNKSQAAVIDKEIVKKGNIQKACTYAEIHFNTFKKSLKGGRIRQEQREKLIEFCDLVKEKSAA